MVLDAAVLEQYTNRRLVDGDEEAARNLAAGLAAARRWCGWHVTPVRESEVEIDGPGGALLRLPTLRLVELVSVVEDGVALDLVEELEWSRIGLIRKRSGANWSHRLGAITVTMDHGFTEGTDFEAAVLSFVDRRSQAPAGGLPVAVGPFRWSEEEIAEGSAFSMVELSILESYRLERPA